MTTNTTKIAEAIGILSSVLSDEVASTKHFVEEEETEEVDLDEFVTVDEYEELKEAVTDTLPDALTEIESMKEDINLVIDIDNDQDDDWDDDDDDDEKTDEDDNKTEPSAEEKLAMLEQAGVELQQSNDQLTETLQSIHAGLVDLEGNLTLLQDDVESR